MTSEDHRASITSSFLSYNRFEKPTPISYPFNECIMIKDDAKRWTIVKKQKLCFSCLESTQIVRMPVKIQFAVVLVKEKHHTSTVFVLKINQNLTHIHTTQTRLNDLHSPF